MTQPTSVNCQTALASIDPGNGCNQVTHWLVGFTSEFVTQPEACIYSSCGKVSRMGFCCCRKYPLHCRCLQRQWLTKLDYIMQLRPTLGKEPCVNSEVSAQTKLSAMGMNTASNMVVKVSNATAQGNPFTEKVSLPKQPFLTSAKLLPRCYELARPLDLINIITSWLSQSAHNDKLRPLNKKLTRFHSKTVPRISVYGYLLQLTRHAALSSPILWVWQSISRDCATRILHWEYQVWMSIGFCLPAPLLLASALATASGRTKFMRRLVACVLGN